MPIEASTRDPEAIVKSWGFKSVFTWTDRPNAYYAPHSHKGLTTHYILSGSLKIQYPDDSEVEKEEFGPGSRLDVDAGREHEVWIGPGGCTYVIGE